MAVAGTTCSITRGIFRDGCDRPAIATCVYCGRPFCDAHGERGPDYADACSRKTCRTKARDVVEHQAWRQRAGQANRLSTCAAEECESRMKHSCLRCRLMFCAEHVRVQRLSGHAPGTPHAQRGVVCGHCSARRKLWD